MTSYSQKDIEEIERKQAARVYAPAPLFPAFNWGKLLNVLKTLALFMILAHCVAQEYRIYRIQRGLQNFGKELEAKQAERRKELQEAMKQR